MKLVQIHYTFVIDSDEALEKCQSVEELDNYVGRKFSESLTDLDGLLHHELASLLDYSDFPDELYQQISNRQK